MPTVNRSSLAPSGSGRDSYIVMDKSVRDGRGEHGSWMPNLRSAPVKSGQETLYGESRSSATLKQLGASSVKSERTEPAGARQVPDAPGEKALRQIMKRTSSSLVIQRKRLSDGSISSMPTRSGGSTGFSAAHTVASPNDASAVSRQRSENVHTARAAASFRLRLRSQSSTFG
eukprot:CAMPEP_0171062320 /NCGR_PEP_ID=MMETSP0766_2-20121228/4998_1 /TAXON_ID=439317 /ORGANISM="Gambierdiscus australes, Strain CAWD 149" /LENGTH=172 /DNA_ID=CAMNT_0011518117 /DNA_START=43 /DNA_END=561 /DNA_ORIENTATION=+